MSPSAVALVSLLLFAQEPSEPKSPPSDPPASVQNGPASSSEEKTAPAVPPNHQTEEPAAEAESKPRRPRRGPAPTPSDLTDTEYEMNRDGTIRRRVVRVGGVVNEALSDPEPKTPEIEPDPNWTPPEHSKLGSIHESQNEAASNSPQNSVSTPPDHSGRGLALLIAIVGGLIALGVGVGYLGGRSPAAVAPPDPETGSGK